MHRPTYPHGNPSFDGPGARNIVGEPGPSTILAAAEYPPHQQQASPLQQRAGHSLQHFSTHNHAPGHFRSQASPSTPAHFPAQYSSPVVKVEGGLAHGASAPPLSATGATAQPPPTIKRVGGKANVSSACGPCKRAHLACDVARPCKRCVNMGKPEQCEDVPHKKRGRPKVNRTPVVEPYSNPRPPRQPAVDAGSTGKWKNPPPYESQYVTTTASSSSHAPGTLGTRLPSPPRTASLGPMVGMSPMESAASMSPFHNPPPVSVPSSNMGSAQDNLFTLFCSTELKILRATSLAHSLTGHHLHEFANVNLLDWLHPSDRHLIEMERSRLVTVPYLATQLQSSRETHASIMVLGERELSSPADGMRDPYPHQNVRFLRADGSFGHFNLRLHLGGGLGGSLWHPDSLGKIYLVVSCLQIHERDLPPEASGRRQQPVPLTPVTPMAPPPAHQLPGFSSIAAAADAPPRPETAPTMPTAQSPYGYTRTGVSTPVAAMPPQQSYNIYARPPSQPLYSPVQPPGRNSPSTNQASYPPPLPRTPVYGDPSGAYAPQPSGYYQPPPQAPPYDPNIRRDPGADEWLRRGGASGSMPLPPPTATDYSRRTWEL